jgi:hypothetical protein
MRKLFINSIARGWGYHSGTLRDRTLVYHVRGPGFDTKYHPKITFKKYKTIFLYKI